MCGLVHHHELWWYLWVGRGQLTEDIRTFLQLQSLLPVLACFAITAQPFVRGRKELLLSQVDVCSGCALGRKVDVIVEMAAGNWVRSLQLPKYRLWLRQIVGKGIVLEQSQIHWGWMMFVLCLKWQCQALAVEKREICYRSLWWIHLSMCTCMMRFVCITVFSQHLTACSFPSPFSPKPLDNKICLVLVCVDVLQVCCRYFMALERLP